MADTNQGLHPLVGEIFDLHDKWLAEGGANAMGRIQQANLVNFASLTLYKAEAEGHNAGWKAGYRAGYNKALADARAAADPATPPAVIPSGE